MDNENKNENEKKVHIEPHHEKKVKKKSSEKVHKTKKHISHREKKTSNLWYYVGIAAIIVIIVLVLTLGKSPTTPKKSSNVLFEMYVMSQCPYGVQAENAAIPAVKKFGKEVTLNIEYIGNVDASGNLQSLHGQKEVDGDIIQLCAKKYYPEKYLDFILCQNKNPSDLVSSISSCAQQSGMDPSKLDACKTNEGKQLFLDSIKKAAQKGVQGSPTMFINGVSYEGGRDELSFTRAICSALSGTHSVCEGIPACATDMDCPDKEGKEATCLNPNTEKAECVYVDPVKFELIVINDKRCSSCDASRIIEVSKQLFKGAQITNLDVTDTRAKSLIDQLDIVYAPAFLFDKKVTETKTWTANPRLQSAFEKKGNYYKLLDSQTGASYFISEQKRQEYLNKIGVKLGDNRPQIDFFVMSYCPYGNQAEEAIEPVYQALKNNADFNPHYVIYSNYQGGGPKYCFDKESKYCSMHGIQELNQDVRELCVAKYMGMDKWFEFVLEMNKKCNSNNADTCWEGVADSLKLNKETIKKCFNDDALDLLKKEKELNDILGVSGSPTVFIDGTKYQGQRTPAGFQSSLCAAFETAPKACENTPAPVETTSAPTGGCGS